MDAVTIENLRMLEAKHGTKPAHKKRRLKVFYGWARLGKVRALERQVDAQIKRGDNYLNQ